jgi:hypothetical protein
MMNGLSLKHPFSDRHTLLLPEACPAGLRSQAKGLNRPEILPSQGKQLQNLVKVALGKQMEQGAVVYQ